MGAVLLSLVTPLGMLYNLSWQLSFLAFVGILFLSPLIIPYFSRAGGIGATLGETLSAEVMVLPLVLAKFGVLSVVSPFVNTAVLWVTPLAMGLSMLQTLCALVWLPLAQGLTWVTYPVLVLIVKPIQWASQLSFAAYEIPSFSPVFFMVSYGLVGAVFMLLLLRQRKVAQNEADI